jgi:hypothetical protein
LWTQECHGAVLCHGNFTIPPPSAFLMWNGQMIIHKNLAYQWYPALKIEFLDIPTYLSSLNLLHLRDDEGCGLACWKEMRGRNIEIELAS